MANSSRTRQQLFVERRVHSVWQATCTILDEDTIYYYVTRENSDCFLSSFEDSRPRSHGPNDSINEKMGGRRHQWEDGRPFRTYLFLAESIQPVLHSINITILPHREITIDRCWGGLVGYDDCLTRSRSRVRFPSRVLFGWVDHTF